MKIWIESLRTAKPKIIKLGRNWNTTTDSSFPVSTSRWRSKKTYAINNSRCQQINVSCLCSLKVITASFNKTIIKRTWPLRHYNNNFIVRILYSNLIMAMTALVPEKINLATNTNNNNRTSILTKMRNRPNCNVPTKVNRLSDTKLVTKSQGQALIFRFIRSCKAIYNLRNNNSNSLYKIIITYLSEVSLTNRRTYLKHLAQLQTDKVVWRAIRSVKTGLNNLVEVEKIVAIKVQSKRFNSREERDSTQTKISSIKRTVLLISNNNNKIRRTQAHKHQIAQTYIQRIQRIPPLHQNSSITRGGNAALTKVRNRDTLIKWIFNEKILNIIFL